MVGSQRCHGIPDFVYLHATIIETWMRTFYVYYLIQKVEFDRPGERSPE